MTATVERATAKDAGHIGVPVRAPRVAGAAVLALIMTAAAPACAKDETIFSNFLNALVPNAIAARSETPPAPPEAETKAAPRKADPRPVTIRPRVSTKLAIAPPPTALARETLPPDPTLTTGATAQAAPTPQAQPQPQPQPQSQGLPAPAASPAAAAAPKPAAKPRTDTAAKSATKSAPQPKPAPAGQAGDADSEAALFCRNITDAATDARFSWQVRVLEDLDKQVKESVTRLEAKRAEYEEWLKRREDFLHKVEDGVVEMYGRMRPDAAALQIASMTEEVALSVLMKLKPRASSAILSEMEPARAARLTDSLAGVRLTTQQGKTP